MTERIAFEGFVKDVRYRATLNDAVVIYDFDTFDIQTARSCGLVRYSESVFAYFDLWLGLGSSKTSAQSG